MGAETETPQIRGLSERLFGGSSSAGHLVNDIDRELGPALHSLRPPDIIFSPDSPDIGFVHRSIGWADLYFLANTGNQSQRAQATFRIDGRAAEWWDPFTGEMHAARVLPGNGAGTSLALDLEPYGSRILIFS